MNLVNELQESASKDDVLTVLRKTRRLASKLKRQDISEWLQAEQDGYKFGQSVPDYRRITTTPAYNTNGYVPAGYGYLMKGIETIPSFDYNLRVPMREPISQLLSVLEGKRPGDQIYLPVAKGEDIDLSIRSHVRFDPEFSSQITLLLRLNESQIRAIPDHIKNKVLDWACDLEEAGVTGDGMSFSAKEIEKAHSITFNINGCSIDQLNNMGANQKGRL